MLWTSEEQQQASRPSFFFAERHARAPSHAERARRPSFSWSHGRAPPTGEIDIFDSTEQRSSCHSLSVAKPLSSLRARDYSRWQRPSW
jgi:hypothetical protein